MDHVSKTKLPREKSDETTYPQILEGGTLLITGSDHEIIATEALKAISKKAAVILVPSDKNINIPQISNGPIVELVLNQGQKPKTRLIKENKSGFFFQPGSLTLYTSGSTGIPKAVHFSNSQLKLTSGWYKKIYGLTSESLIISPLPSTYNFPFIAGALTAAEVGCRYLYAPILKLINNLSINKHRADKIILLANPVSLEAICAAEDNFSKKRLLIDTGGAPISKSAIQYIRDKIGDVREGYGLTETCSLTHYDVEGTADSLGSVGVAMAGVQIQLKSDYKSQPQLWISSPNMGMVLGAAHDFDNNFYPTGDYATVDSKNRLRILGRTSDFNIGGLYPRDTLDLIGPILQTRCALIQHTSPTEIAVKLIHAEEPTLTAKIKSCLSHSLDLPPSNITVNSQQGQLTHSMKLTRTNKSEEVQ